MFVHSRRPSKKKTVACVTGSKGTIGCGNPVSRAEVAVGVVVAAIAAVADVRAAIRFSSFAVLLYYGVANASAWTLDRSPLRRAVPAVGLAGCLLLAVFLPVSSVLAGVAVVAAGAGIYAVRRVTAR